MNIFLQYRHAFMRQPAVACREGKEPRSAMWLVLISCILGPGYLYLRCIISYDIARYKEKQPHGVLENEGWFFLLERTQPSHWPMGYCTLQQPFHMLGHVMSSLLWHRMGYKQTQSDCIWKIHILSTQAHAPISFFLAGLAMGAL